MNFDSALGKNLKFPAELCPLLLCIFVELDYLGKLSEAKMTLRRPPDSKLQPKWKPAC